MWSSFDLSSIGDKLAAAATDALEKARLEAQRLEQSLYETTEPSDGAQDRLLTLDGVLLNTGAVHTGHTQP